MSTQPSSRTAAARSTTAARVAAVFGVGAVVGLVMTGAGSGVGFAMLLVSLTGLYMAYDQHVGLRDLAQIGPAPVGTLARRPTILPAEASASSLLPLVSALPSDEHCLVRTDDGWRLLTVAMVTDVALTARGTVHLDVVGRKAATIPWDLRVDRLPRPPSSGETWVVLDGPGAAPKIFNRAALVIALAELTADANEATTGSVDADVAA